MYHTFVLVAGIVWSMLADVAGAQTPADQPIRTIELFNGKNLEGLKIYFEDVTVSAADIWKVDLPPGR